MDNPELIFYLGRSNSWHTQQPPLQPKVQPIVRRQFRDSSSSVSISAVTPASVISNSSTTVDTGKGPFINCVQKMFHIF